MVKPASDDRFSVTVQVIGLRLSVMTTVPLGWPAAGDVAANAVRPDVCDPSVPVGASASSSTNRLNRRVSTSRIMA